MYNLDVTLLELVHSVHTSWLDQLAIALTQLGGAVFLTLVVSLGAVSLFRQRRTKAASFLVLTVGGASLINLALKLIFQRDRPSLWETLIHETTYSFPSGHAMGSSALAFAIIILLWHTRWRALSLISGASYIFLVGLTRVYLGVHYPSDIIAGWIMSAVLTLLVYRLIYTHPKPTSP